MVTVCQWMIAGYETVKRALRKRTRKSPDTSSVQGFFLISIWKNLLVVLPYAIDTDDNGDKHESTGNDHNRKHGHGGLLYRYRFQKKETHSRKSVQKFVEGTLLP